MKTEVDVQKFKIQPLQSALGAEIIGLDLRLGINPDQLRSLMQAWHNHIFLLFREQSLSEQQQLAFCAQFGPLFYLAAKEGAKDARPKPLVRIVSNDSQRATGQIQDTDMTFHHDGIFREIPQKAVCMHALEIPTYGGNTRFSNMYAAYDALPEEVKQIIDTRTALHSYSYSQTERVNIDKCEEFEHFEHPIVIRHPSTGRKTLFVNRLMTMRIQGLENDDSKKLLDLLFDHSESPRFYYEHVWHEGDVLLWDNLACIHSRTDIPKDQRRVLRHTALDGEPIPR